MTYLNSGGEAETSNTFPLSTPHHIRILYCDINLNIYHINSVVTTDNMTESELKCTKYFKIIKQTNKLS